MDASDGEDNLTEDDEDYDGGEVEVDEADEAALNMFMDTTGGKRKNWPFPCFTRLGILNLGDMILAKIKEKEMQAEYIDENAGPDAIQTTLDPKVFEVYSQ